MPRLAVVVLVSRTLFTTLMWGWMEIAASPPHVGVVKASRRTAGSEDSVGRYFNEIGRYPLLTKEDEARLGQVVADGLAAREVLSGDAELSAQRKKELRKAIAAGEEATKQFVQSNLRLVVSVAKNYQWSGLPLLDLIQEGNIGLMHAVEKFDWSLGFKFSTYATWWVRQAVSRGVENTSRTVRLPEHASAEAHWIRRAQGEMEAETGRPPSLAELAEEMGVDEGRVAMLLRFDESLLSLDASVGEDTDATMGDLVASPGTEPVLDAVVQGMEAEHVAQLLSCLPDFERAVVCLRFGLDGDSPRSLAEVGKLLHRSRETVRMAEQAAFSRMRGAADGDGLDLLSAG